MKIRDDLEGVVYVRTEDGVVAMKAGDTVPAGAEVGDHLTKTASPKSESSDKSDGDDVSAKRGRRPARSKADD